MKYPLKTRSPSLLLALLFGSLFLFDFSTVRNQSNPPLTGSRPDAKAQATKAPAAKAMAGMPLAFIENRGQWQTKARYVSRLGGMMAGFEEENVKLCFFAQKDKGVMLELGFEGAAEDTPLVPGERLPGAYNFFLGNDPKAWRTNVPAYGSLSYVDIYDGVDLRFREGAAGLEYDLLLAPGSDPSAIVIRVSGNEDLEVSADGRLRMKTAVGVIEQTAPETWEQLADGQRRTLNCSYRRIDEHRFGFAVDGWDDTLAMVIDPSFTLAFSTYLGGTAVDQPLGVEVDASGNTIVCGYTLSTDFPTTTGAFQTSAQGQEDIFVSKINDTGSALVFSTYIGGSGSDTGSTGIGLDGSGNIVLASTTDSANFPTTAGAYQIALAGGLDAVVLKLSANGSSLLYGSYLGGSNDDLAMGLAVDSLGNAYITGSAEDGFPVTAGSYDTSFNGDPARASNADVFVAKMSLSGNGSNDLIFSTYIGGESWERPFDLALDSSGNVHLVGWSWDNRPYTVWYPTTSNALIESYRVKRNSPPFNLMFMSKLSADGTSLLYSTYLSNTNWDAPNGVAVDSFGLSYLVGSTSNTELPMTSDAYDNSYNGVRDVFLLILDTTKSGSQSLVYGTYLGGGAQDEGMALVVDAQRNIHITGCTFKPESGGGGKGKPKPPPAPFPTTEGAAHQGGGDAYVVSFARDNNNDTWTFAYSRLFGGANDDWSRAIALDSFSSLYVAGTTNSSDFPTAGSLGVLDPTLNDAGGDAFVLKLGYSNN